MTGFIKLHRQLLVWEWYDDIPVRLTFFHLLLKANWEDKNWKGITIKRGQILTGSIETSKEIGITRQQFRRAIKLLKTTNEITTKTTNKNTLVTLVNYNKYQDNEKETTNKTTSNATNGQPSKNHQRTTTKEYKNKRIKEVKNLKEREADFKKSLTPFLEDFGKDVLNKFFLYWTETNPRGKKMRYEKQKTFNASRRLNTWIANDEKWKKEKNTVQKEKKTGAQAFRDKVLNG